MISTTANAGFPLMMNLSPDSSASSTPTRVVCVDDNELVLGVLKRMGDRNQDITIVATLPSADTLLATVEREKPDVVVLDLEMPGLNPMVAMKQLAKTVPTARVVVLTGRLSLAAVEQSFEAGAYGFVTKADPPAQILKAIRDAAKGKGSCSAEARELYGMGQGPRLKNA